MVGARSNREHDDLNSIPVITAAILYGVVAISIFPIMPIFVGALVDHLDFTSSQSGYVTSADIIGIAVGNLLAYFWVNHINWRRMAVLSVLILFTGNIICISTTHFVPMLILRFIIGLAEGSALALTYAILGGSGNPDRNYAFFLFGSLGSGAINVFLLSALISSHGLGIVFIDLALLSLIPACFIRFVPASGYREAMTSGVADTEIKPAVLLLPVIIVLIANLIYFIGQGGVWAYLERIGIADGLSIKQVASGLSTSLLLGVIGALTASLLNVRWGRVVPLGLAIVAAILSVILLQWKITLSTFIVAVCVWNFANNFGHPYLLGYLAAIDKSGRYVVVSAAMQTGGMGLGPAIVALSITGADYDSVLWFGLVCFTLALLLFIPIMILVKGVDNRDIAPG